MLACTSFASRLTPDGKYLVVPAPKTAALHIWDTATGKQVAQTRESAYPAQIAFSGDSHRMTTLSRDGKLRIWETATGKLVQELVASTDALEKVGLSVDGKFAATMSRHDQGIHLWNVTTGKELHGHAGHRGNRLLAAFAPDGQSVLTADFDGRHSSSPGLGYSSLHRWDFRAGKKLGVWHSEPTTEVRHAAFSPDGRFLATANGAGRLRLYDTANGKELRSWDLPTQVITIKIGSEVKTHNSLAVESRAFSLDSAVIAAPSRGKISLYETATGRRLRELPRPAEAIPRCCFYLDGRSLLVTEGVLGAPLCRIDAETGAELGRFDDAKDSASVLGISRDGRHVARIRNKFLEMYDGHTNQLRWNVPLEEWSFALAFSPDNRSLATGGRDAVMRLWDVATGRAVQGRDGHSGPISSLAFSQDGRWLVSGDANVALVWEMPTKTEEKK
jgi:WD40 repeat protein